MPLIKGKHDGRSARITVGIIDAARHSEYKKSQGSEMLRGVTPFKALIDTGATSTMLSRRVIEQLQLQPVTKLQFANLAGTTWVDGYLFHVAFYEQEPVVGSKDPSKIHIYKTVINGGGLSYNPSFDVLLGMDLITTGRLVIDSDGTFAFSFKS